MLWKRLCSLEYIVASVVKDGNFHSRQLNLNRLKFFWEARDVDWMGWMVADGTAKDKEIYSYGID